MTIVGGGVGRQPVPRWWGSRSPSARCGFDAYGANGCGPERDFYRAESQKTFSSLHLAVFILAKEFYENANVRI